MTQVSIMRDVWDSLGLYWNQKDLKSGKKWLCYGQFNDGRLRDSSEYYVGGMGFIRGLLEPKRSKIGQEMAEYGQFNDGRLRDSSEYHVGCMGFIRALLKPKISKIGQEMADLWPFYQWEVVRLQ